MKNGESRLCTPSEAPEKQTGLRPQSGFEKGGAAESGGLRLPRQLASDGYEHHHRHDHGEQVGDRLGKDNAVQPEQGVEQEQTGDEYEALPAACQRQLRGRASHSLQHEQDAEYRHGQHQRAQHGYARLDHF